MSDKKRTLPPEYTNTWSINTGNNNNRKKVRKTKEYSDVVSTPVESVEPARSSHVNVASDVKMAPKALKACRSCRKSKIKCEVGEDGMKCKRCQEQGMECIFEIKVPTASSSTVPDAQWMSTVESRLDKFGSTLDSILTLLKGSNLQLPQQCQQQQSQQEQHGIPELHDVTQREYAQYQTQFSNSSPSSSPDSVRQDHMNDMFQDFWMGEDTQLPYDDVLFLQNQQQRNGQNTTQSQQQSDSSQQTTNGLRAVEPFDLFDLGADGNQVQRQSGTVESVTFEQAQELFTFFHEKISPHLFGFPVSNMAMPVVWERSPILTAAICTVASIHHNQLNTKFDSLKRELETLAQQVMYKTMHSETETIDTIVALCVAGFWLPNSFMLTSVALRLAQNLGLSMPSHVKDQIQNGAGDRVDKDRLRLWYLLYILDGHQSLVYNQVPSIPFDDPAVVKSRTFLLADKSGEMPSQGQHYSTAEQQEKDSQHRTAEQAAMTDMRLVSQVEFNQAVKSIFEGRGWDLLKPSSIGIPWQTNIELDKWMVSWACLLTPSAGKMGSWPSKSTLIHYNFAKMHINSRAIREIQTTNCRLGDLENAITGNRVQDLSEYESNDGDRAADNIAVSAAQNVLKLSTTDKDILSALQYVPVHIHMMLYYAALLILHSVSLPSSSKSAQSKRAALGLVRRLRQAMLGSLPVSRSQETSTGQRPSHNLIAQIADGLDAAVTNKTLQLQQRYDYQIADLMGGEDEAKDTNKGGSIAAWPGSVASHSR